MESISLFFILSVFAAGVFSFFSPCILPVLPVYVGLLSSGDENAAHPVKGKMVKVFFFILGLSVSFFIMGFSAGALGALIGGNTFFILCGVIVVLLGIHQTGLINVRFLQRQKTLDLEYNPKKGLFSTFLLGFVFSFGWTPCVGPILGAVLGLSAQAGGALTGGILLLIYSLGLSIPFVLLAMGAQYFLSKVKAIYPHMSKIKIVGGLLIVFMGFWMIFNQLEIMRAVDKASMTQTNIQETVAEDEASDFTLLSMDGEQVTLSDYKGQTVYLKFWATWCPSCLAGLEDFKQLASDYEDSEDVEVLSVISPGIKGEMSKEEFTQWANANDITFSVLFDETGAVNQMYNIKGYPSAVIIDKEGNIVETSTGMQENEDIKEKIEKQE